MTNPTPTSPEGAARSGLSRRAVSTTIAWTVPTIAAAVAAPLAAASGELALSFTAVPTGNACSSLGPLSIHAQVGTASAPNTTVNVTLDLGLTFADGTNGPKPFVTDAAGNITITGIKAASVGGTFSVLATSGSASANATIVTTPATTGGLVYTFNQNNAATVVPGATDVVELHSTDKVYFARRSNGQIYRWGSGTGATTPTLVPGLTGATIFDAWGYTTTLNADYNGALAVVGGAVYKFDGSSAATVVPGLSGIVAVDANDGFNLALSSTGTVYRWGQGTPNTTPTAVAGITGASKIAGWGYHPSAFQGGGLALVGSTAYQFGLSGAATAVSVANVVDVQSNPGANYVLTASGQVYWWGTATGQSSPTLVPGLSGVTKLSTWGRQTNVYYTGGLAMTPTGIYVFTQAQGNNIPPVPATPQSFPSQVIDIQAHDSAYFARTSDGRAFRWGSGVVESQSPTSTPQQIPGLSGIDKLSSWGFHDGNASGTTGHYSGGLAAAATVCA